MRWYLQQFCVSFPSVLHFYTLPLRGPTFRVFVCFSFFDSAFVLVVTAFSSPDAICSHLQLFSVCRRKDNIPSIYGVLGTFSCFFIFPRNALLSFWVFLVWGNFHVFYRWDCLKRFGVVGKVLTTTLGVIIGYGYGTFLFM